MKGKSKRIVSGFLTALTIISSIVQPVTTYAAEAEPAAYEAEYPNMEKVKDALAEDEIVTAEDYEVEAGTGFDVKSDFSGMKIHPEKVKVTYHEAKNQNGQAFDGNKAVLSLEVAVDGLAGNGLSAHALASENCLDFPARISHHPFVKKIFQRR